MDGQSLLIGGVVAIFVALTLLMVLVVSASSERQQVNRSLAAIQAIEAVPASMRRELDQPFAQRVIAPMLVRFTSLGRRFAAGDRVSNLQRRLELAGSPANWDVDRVLAFKIVGLIVGLILGILIPLAMGASVAITVLVAAGLGVAGLYAPEMTLYQLAYNRQERMRKDLPDALDLLTVSVEAGLGFDAALAQVARNTEGPLAEEFFRVLQEMQIGVGRSEAMRAFAERTDIPELRSFVTAMVQADAFGIPIANVLRVQAKEMRVKRSQRAEEQAQKVPVKILFPLIFCIMPALFIVIIGPASITIFHHFFQGHLFHK